MRKFILTIFIIVLILIILGLWMEIAFRPEAAAPIQVPQDKAYLQGKICKPKGWMPFTLPGLARAGITLKPGDYCTKTDKKGRFSVPSVRPGLYQITISAKGYETAVIDNVALNAGEVTILPDEALFPEITGPPEAVLALSALVPFKKVPEAYPYLTTCYLDATASKNISRYGIRWETRDEKGALVLDPHRQSPTPLQPKRSPIPGTPPSIFLFTPPRPGTFTVTLFLTNDFAAQEASSAFVTVKAANTPPEVVARVIPGPKPPQKVANGEFNTSSGLKIVKSGDPVTLMGWGLDKNHATPERYNPGGGNPDIYGKNHTYWQRQFRFTWRLNFLSENEEDPVDISHILKDPEGNINREGQVVSFVASLPGKYEALLRVEDNDPSGSLVSEQASLSILSLADGDKPESNACADCHIDQVERYQQGPHASSDIGCANCHGPAQAHLALGSASNMKKEDYRRQKKETQDVSREAGLCGQCHDQYAQWEKSHHSDGPSYGYSQVPRPLLVECTKCHYARTFANTLKKADREGVAFHVTQYKKRAGKIGPQMPDFSKVPQKDESGITCVACHNPHGPKAHGRLGIRMNPTGSLCQTCHHGSRPDAVQDALFKGKVQAGSISSPAGKADRPENPHLTESECILCHMAGSEKLKDTYGVRRLGGHTMRMRDAGENGRFLVGADYVYVAAEHGPFQHELSHCHHHR